MGQKSKNGREGEKTWLVDCGSLPSSVLSKSALLPLLPPSHLCFPTRLFSLCITLSQFLTFSLTFTFSHPPSQSFFSVTSPLPLTSTCRCILAPWNSSNTVETQRLPDEIHKSDQPSLCKAKDLILVSPSLRQAFHFHSFLFFIYIITFECFRSHAAYVSV